MFEGGEKKVRFKEEEVRCNGYGVSEGKCSIFNVQYSMGTAWMILPVLFYMLNIQAYIIYSSFH